MLVEPLQEFDDDIIRDRVIGVRFYFMIKDHVLLTVKDIFLAPSTDPYF